MARGKSPVIGENGVLATPSELSALTSIAKETLQKSLNSLPVDLHNVEEVNKAIIGYFEECEKNGTRPGNMGLYRALGMTKQDVNNAITGKSKAKVSGASLDSIKKTLLIMSEYREMLGSTGKLNPATLIFWQKNFDSLSDVQIVEHTIQQEDAHMLTQEDINKRIPVYSDAEIGDE